MLLPAAAMTMAAMLSMTGLAAAETTTIRAPAPGATTSGGRAESVVALRVDGHVMAGDSVEIRGRTRPEGRRWVTVRVGGRKLKTLRSERNGSFIVRWNAPRAGVFKLAATVQANGQAKRGRSRSRQVNAYRAAHASYYGPGLYGGRTACGRKLTPSTVGVANKSLPCGTEVTFRYRGRTVQAPVIDRGPYAGDREWDLTSALKAKLGFGSTGMVLSTR